MVEVQDTVIKLFGKNITLPENGKMIVASGGQYAGDSSAASSNHDCILKKMNNKTCLEAKKVDRTGEEEAQKDHNLPEESTNSKALPISKDDESDTSNYSEKKTLKKPEKIIACPRCNSMDTKFCYYNNYNVNQPRHFCKSCQRYWTSGGTMRNVPVGSGHRKNKNHSASYSYLHNPHTTTVSDEVARVNGILGPNFKHNGTLLSFDSASQLCDSVASVFSLTEKRAPNGTKNGIYKLDQGVLVPCKGEENGSDFSVGSSVTSLNPTVEGARKGIQDPRMQNIHGFPSQFPYLSGVPWPYYPWNCTVPVSGIPNPVYPVPYWNCNVLGGWSNPWLSPKGTSNQTALNSGSSSPALGKHSRDGELINETNPKLEEKTCERSILVLETLKIDGPDEAAKNSICRGGLFKAFQAKGGKKHIIEAASPVLQANPAAMSRSLSFQERT